MVLKFSKCRFRYVRSVQQSDEETHQREDGNVSQLNVISLRRHRSSAESKRKSKGRRWCWTQGECELQRQPASRTTKAQLVIYSGRFELDSRTRTRWWYFHHWITEHDDARVFPKLIVSCCALHKTKIPLRCASRSHTGGRDPTNPQR